MCIRREKEIIRVFAEQGGNVAPRNQRDAEKKSSPGHCQRKKKQGTFATTQKVD